RLIYSGFAKSEHQGGTDWEMLPYLDEGRPVSVTHTAAGTWVGIDYRGLETFFHLNGVPAGYVSHDHRVMPDSPVDLMIATLPVVMHEAPQSVCFLGWGTGIPVATALDFPLQQIDCFERDAILPGLTFSADSSRRYGLNPFQDDRVRLRSIPPEIAVRAIQNRYDVIISQPVRSEEILSVAEFTREYYQACADRLNVDGLFCQRFQHLDHGPDASIDVIQTLKSVFPYVAMVDTSPGETLLIASRARDLDTTEFLVERLQRDHVRRILARCGWDWAHVLKLPSIGSKSLDQLTAEAGGLVNSVLNHSVAVTHPSDAMRWSNKWNEKIERFSPFKQRYVDLAGEPGKQADVTRRMEELGSQRYVMAKASDKPWAYRASIKELLQTKPRSILIQTKGEKPHNEMHPVDQHRIDYLKALSLAYREKTPSAERIHALTSFIEPYDPLISYFLHYEAAELYSRNPELDPRVEYLHLLNTIYFADMQDRSIHNVVRAIELVHEHPEIVESERTRFDQLNGLLQTLTNRWHLRRGETPDSTDQGLTDVDESLAAAEAVLGDLRTLAETSGYGTDAWSKRERILEQMLVRPLRGYRGKLLPYHEKSLRRKTSTSEETTQLSEMDEPAEITTQPVE
ncbi:MAG TPA: hypothetical protein VLA12_01600, partial [Planctomycetaceae bacterium]|nr:hypothetical protein [Planctomycetaceae bacterium]